MKVDADVVVVGAGPAGSACALALARSGFAVRIFDRAHFPRTKPCGEYVNVGAVEELDALGVGEALRGTAHPIRGLRLFGSRTSVEIDFEKPAYSVARSVLDDTLLRVAVSAGAIFQRGQVENVSRFDRGFGIDVRDAAGESLTLRASILVAADGANSTVARKLGVLRRTHGPVKFALGGHYEGFEQLGDRIEMYVSGEAYFAVNPLSATLANVMVVVEARALQSWRDDVEGRMRQTARALGADRRDLERVRLQGKRVAIGPLLAGTRRAANHGALFVGDAAAFVDPFTGQGVLLALRSARAAAQAIERALRGSTSSAVAWDEYVREHAEMARERRTIATLAGWIVRRPRLARTAAAIARYSSRPFRLLVRAVSGAR